MDKREKNLFEDFERTQKTTWAEKATTDLKNEDVFEKYSWKVEENISLHPYYDQTDLKDGAKYRPYHNRLLLKDNPTGDIRYWENIQQVSGKDPVTANKEALEALNNGADGIIFDLRANNNIAYEKLLQDILPDYCHISLVLGQNPVEQVEGYLAYINDKGIDPLALNGFIFQNEGAHFPDLFNSTINQPGLRSLNISTKETVFSQQIADLLRQATNRIDQLSEAGHDIEQIVSQINFSIQISKDYFGEIAKLRALRNLFFQMVRAYGMDTFNPEDVHLHCISPAWTEEKYQPHANMLKSTTAAMSAVLGGCDSLLVEPEDKSNKLLIRIARNVSTILKEESYFNKTVDPAAGAYFIEVLTDKLAQEAWQVFQHTVKTKREETQNL